MAIRRGVGLVLTLIGLAVLVSVLGLAAAFMLVGRGPAIAQDSTLVLRIEGDLEEIEPSGVISQFLVSAPTVRSVVENLRKAKVDSRIRGVLVVPSATGAVWGKVQEIRDAIVDFKESGKPIVAFLEYGGEKEYYLATACDRVYLAPASPLDLTGIAIYELFLRGTLDKIGAYPDMLHIGEYKTAANNLTETDFTEAHREMTESLATDLFDQIVRGVATGRNLDESRVRSLIDEGPFLPEEAVRAQLVDELAYADEVIAKAGLPAEMSARLDADEYAAVTPASLGLEGGSRIALVYAVGIINLGESRYDSPQGPVLGSETLIDHLRRARENEDIGAIVLRVDSPGGSAVASDVIWREVMLAREKKPVIVSMSDVAASGGYYIAMPAHAIVAQPGTLTGSIGVVTGKIVTGGTFEKIGANIEAVSRGANAEINSPDRPYSETERQKVEEQMHAIYDLFVEKAAQGRNTTPERIDAVAQGRVWTGRQAKQVGLVDELGGVARALELAKERAGIAADDEVELVIYPPKKTFFELLRDPLGTGESRMMLLRAALGREELQAFQSIVSPLQLFRAGEPLALMPHFIWR